MFGNKTETARYKIVEQKFTKYSKPFYSIYDKLEEHFIVDPTYMKGAYSAKTKKEAINFLKHLESFDGPYEELKQFLPKKFSPTQNMLNCTEKYLSVKLKK